MTLFLNVGNRCGFDIFGYVYVTYHTSKLSCMHALALAEESRTQMQEYISQARHCYSWQQCVNLWQFVNEHHNELREPTPAEVVTLVVVVANAARVYAETMAIINSDVKNTPIISLLDAMRSDDASCT